VWSGLGFRIRGKEEIIYRSMVDSVFVLARCVDLLHAGCCMRPATELPKTEPDRIVLNVPSGTRPDWIELP